jgi:phage-related holin
MLTRLQFDMEFLKYLGVGLSAWAMGFIMPISSFLVFTVALVVMDFMTGVQAARHRGEKLRSRGFMRSVQKITLYFAAIMLARGMDTVFFSPKGMFFDLTWLVAILIAITEFKSNLENISAVTGVGFWRVISERLPTFLKIKKNGE